MDAVSAVARGHVLLALCAACYLVWWCIFFRPGAQVAGPLRWFGYMVFALTVAFGAWGILSAASALGRLPGAEGMALWPYWAGAIAGYAVALLATRGVFGRQVTTELVLIVAWCAFECAVIAALAQQVILVRTATLLYVLVTVLVMASLVCYVLYYRVPAWPAFFIGTVPLVAVGVFAISLAAILHSPALG